MSRVIDNLQALYPFSKRYDVIVLDHASFAKARCYTPDWHFPSPGVLSIGGVPVVESDGPPYIIESSPYGPIIHML